MGIEPTIFRFEVGRLIHWATRPMRYNTYEQQSTPKQYHKLQQYYFIRCSAAMAEWLRRLTRNQMGSSRVGSNPTRSVSFSTFQIYAMLFCKTATCVVQPEISCDGRVVKAFDQKSNGIFPRRFESYSQRYVFRCLAEYEKKTFMKSLRHRVLPGGPPSKYYPGPTMLNFRDQTRTGVFIVVWSQTKVLLLHARLTVYLHKSINFILGKWGQAIKTLLPGRLELPTFAFLCQY